MRLRVECYAGHRGDETPRRLVVGDRALDVVEVVDRWIGPDHRYFKLRVASGATWVVRQDLDSGAWEVASYAGAAS
jgi:hypothetical protein